jgi:hypothetical protein
MNNSFALLSSKKLVSLPSLDLRDLTARFIAGCYTSPTLAGI